MFHGAMCPASKAPGRATQGWGCHQTLGYRALLGDECQWLGEGGNNSYNLTDAMTTHPIARGRSRSCLKGSLESGSILGTKTA